MILYHVFNTSSCKDWIVVVAKKWLEWMEQTTEMTQYIPKLE